MLVSIRPVLLAAVVVAVAAGCSGPRPQADRPHPDARRVAALTDSLARTTGPTDRSALVARRLRAVGATPLAAGSFVAAEGVVAGFAPGRQPLGRPTLLVVGVSAQSGSVPAVLEAVRVLVARSRWEVVPERTVMVAFWEGDDADASLRRVLDGGLWPRAAVHGILVVDAPPTDLTIPAQRVEGGADVGAAARLVERIAAASRFVASPDTLASP